MSRRDPKYENSIWEHISLWCRGKYEPLAGKLEIKAPEEKSKAVREAELLRAFVSERNEHEESYMLGLSKQIGGFRRIYPIIAIFFAMLLTGLLLITVRDLSAFGKERAPENNEVSKRYIEKGLEETGAVNIVAGMILDYRAFDTFGESCVLFVAVSCVLLLLRVDKEEDPHSQAVEDMSDRYFEPHQDTILQMAARILVSPIILFGIYVVLNGHISPGGGFSGGAIIGTGLILYLTAFGFGRTGRFMREKLVKFLTVSALTFYCFAKSYSFYTGANGLHSVITTGTAGNILSAGLIVYLNICVGIVVACTMYSFYVMFRKGGF